MESGTPPPDRSSDPQSPAPGGPESPGGPQSPAPGPQSPAPGPQSPAPGGAPTAPGPQSPAGPGPQAPPQSGPSYGGPVPPGGWQTPATQQASPWAGAPLAGWGSRAGALVLDVLILLVPVIVLIIVIFAVAAGSDTGAVVTGILGFLSYFIATLFYAPVLMSRKGAHNGKTFGKQIVGIRVARDNGQPYELGSAFVRELAVKQLLFGFVGGFFFSIPTLLDYLWPLWDDQNRALHDMVVKSHVLKA